jgi:hypothetical protein
MVDCGLEALPRGGSDAARVNARAVYGMLMLFSVRGV